MLPLIAQINTEITLPSVPGRQHATLCTASFSLYAAAFFFFFLILLELGFFSSPLTGIFCGAFTGNFFMLVAVVVSQALLELSLFLMSLFNIGCKLGLLYRNGHSSPVLWKCSALRDFLEYSRELRGKTL